MAVVLTRRDWLAVATACGVIAVSAVVGAVLNHRGYDLVLPAPPLIAHWSPHLGWGTPLVMGCVLAAIVLQRAADILPWRRLIMIGWSIGLAWLCSLTLIDGITIGWTEVLTNPNEYLHDLPRVGDPLTFISTFTEHIVDGPQAWTTHVAAHPPLATLVFWGLERIGLSGGFWAGALCIVASSAIMIALPVTVRELGSPHAARRLVPLLAVFPGAVWMGVSADGLFAGVATSGLALVCVGANRRRWLPGLAGGVLLGLSTFLSYGSVLVGVVAIAALVITVRARGRRALAVWGAALGGALAVMVVHLGLGFNWFSALHLLRIRYHQGIAADRPYWYFVFANFGAWLVSCSPLLAVGIVRAVDALAIATRSRSRVAVVQVGAAQAGGGEPELTSRDRRRRCDGRACAGETPKNRGERARGRRVDLPVALLCLSGVAAAVIADLSGLTKAETERIWLSYGVIAFSGLALLRGRAARWALLGSAGTAIVVNHLFATGW